VAALTHTHDILMKLKKALFVHTIILAPQALTIRYSRFTRARCKMAGAGLDVELSDERDADDGDDDGGGDAEDDVVPEGEVVCVARRPASLLAHDQVRRRPQQRQVARHRAHPRQQQPRLDHGRRRDERRRRGHLSAHQKHCMQFFFANKSVQRLEYICTS
jgi:hypothetical protein